jgi:rhodanese-related sulfurtransferase
LTKTVDELPLEKPIVVYCDCPEDQGAVEIVKFLKKNGAKNVRPLKGGLSGWILSGHPTAHLDATLLPRVAI